MQVQTTKGEDMKLSIDQPGRASVARRLTTAGAAAAMVLGIALASVGPASAGTSAKGLATATARLNAYTAPPKWRSPSPSRTCQPTRDRRWPGQYPEPSPQPLRPSSVAGQRSRVPAGQSITS